MYVNLFLGEMKVKFKKLSSCARLPTLAAPGSACLRSTLHFRAWCNKVD